MAIPNNAQEQSPWAAAPSPPQNWESNILVPITQNLTGGLATTIILSVLNLAWTRANHLPFDLNETMIWTGIAGTIVTTATTIVRFYADEIGLLHAAYSAGQRSRDEEIHRLNRQISLLEQRGQPLAQDATDINKRLGKMKGDLYNATTLLKILLDGGNISRNSGEHDLTQRPWERAVGLLAKAKVINQDRQLIISSRSAAWATLTEFYQQQYDLASANISFQPAWW